jgi:hypothetical protein
MGSSSTAGERPIEIELNPREQRFYDRIRGRVVAPHPGQGSGFRDMLLLLPDLTSCCCACCATIGFR